MLIMTYWKHEPLIIKGARSLLFLLYFLISLYLSHDSSPLLFGVTASGMMLYAVLIVGSLILKKKQGLK